MAEIVGWRITGINEVTRNINEALQRIKVKSGRGLVLAANHVLNDANRTPPKVPVDKGILRASRFIGQTQFNAAAEVESMGAKYKATGSGESSGGKGDVYVMFGYAASYAAAVHEMTESPSGLPINWKRPGSGPKFLQAALARNTTVILNIIAQNARL